MKSKTPPATIVNASPLIGVTIAIIEDEEITGELLSAWVQEMGHVPEWFKNGKDLIKALRTRHFSLFLVDWGLPDIDGIDLVRQLLARDGEHAPIIFCSARGGESDIVEALNVGADDFIVKPPRRDEFAARVAAMLRRAYPQAVEKGNLDIGPYSIDLARRTFSVDGELVELQNREYAVALMLFQSLNGVVSRARITQTLWGNEPMETSRSLDTHVSRIRRKLGIAAERGLVLQSVYGFGYRLQDADTVLPQSVNSISTGEAFRVKAIETARQL